jgi:origin recognition complex subunit 5
MVRPSYRRESELTCVEIIKILMNPSSSSSHTSHPLYPRFLDLILSTLLPLTSLPSEIEYLSSTLWPIYTSTLPPHSEQHLLRRPYPDRDTIPPPLAITVKLLTDLKHQLSLPLTAAIESVLTRQIGRREFESAMTSAGGRKVPKVPGMELPMVAKYLLVAGYCASYNPAKSDMRLFGRGTGPDRRTKKGGGTRRAGYGRVRIGKVSSFFCFQIIHPPLSCYQPQ